VFFFFFFLHPTNGIHSSFLSKEILKTGVSTTRH